MTSCISKAASLEDPTHTGTPQRGLARPARTAGGAAAAHLSLGPRPPARSDAHRSGRAARSHGAPQELGLKTKLKKKKRKEGVGKEN